MNRARIDPTQAAIRGGVVAGKRLRPWRWRRGRSEAVRCRAEQWYVLEAEGPADAGNGAGAEDRAACVPVQIEFQGADRQTPWCAWLEPSAGNANQRLRAWVQSPPGTETLRVSLPAAAQRLSSLLLHPVIERGPKCHPSASVPEWSSYRPPFPLERIFLPESLAPLRTVLGDLPLEFMTPPRSLRQLVARVNGAACVIDPDWIRRCAWTYDDLVLAAGAAWLVIDLESLADLVNRRIPGTTRLLSYRDPHELFSARVNYADVQTRGLALFDVFPYSTLTANGGIEQRGLRSGRAWRKFADERGFATLLAGDAPWDEKSGHVLSAACACGAGELTATDLPWLVAGARPLLAPAIARHLLRMHLGAPLADDVQFSNRWDEGDIVLRDLADLARRYAPLEPVRWAPPARGTVRLGIALPGSPGGRVLVFETGRIDQAACHAGVPPEPPAIFMKQLARMRRADAQTWQRRFGGATIVWQFDSTVGTRHATAYASAASLGLQRCDARLVLRMPWCSSAEPRDQTLPHSGGLLGDRSIDLQSALGDALLEWLSRAATC